MQLSTRRPLVGLAVGSAPPGLGLTKHLQRKGFEFEELEAAGDGRTKTNQDSRCALVVTGDDR